MWVLIYKYFKSYQVGPVASLSIEVEDKTCGTADGGETVTPTEVVLNTPKYMKQKDIQCFSVCQEFLFAIITREWIFRILKFEALSFKWHHQFGIYLLSLRTLYLGGHF